jgi:serine protease Do
MPVAPVTAGRCRSTLALLLAGSMLAWSPAWAQGGGKPSDATGGSQTAPQPAAPSGTASTPQQVERGVRPGEQGPGAVPGTSGTVAVPLNPDTGPHKMNRVVMPDFADLVMQVRPAVVSITVKLRPGTGDEDSGSHEGSSEDQHHSHPTRARGSGFIIDADGTIVTNNHVVKDADSVSVQLDDGNEYPARIIGRDERTDLAVVKVDAGKPVPFLQLGDSSAVRPGEWVLAMGNPFGLGGTVTAGIVSAVGRDIGSGPYDEYLQIDAAINRGNSGGPTFSQDGKVIGVNTAIYSPSGGSVGIGFAIPSNLVSIVVTQLQKTGHVTRGYLGVHAQAIDSNMSKALGVGVNSGALLDTVEPSSPAGHAGLHPGDVVMQVNGKPVSNPRDLAVEVSAIKPGEVVHLQVTRSGASQTFDVTLTEMPGERTAERAPSHPHAGARLGVQVGPLTTELRSRLNVPADVNGAVITDVEHDSRAENAGLKLGDVIVGVGPKAVGSPQEAIAAIRESMKEHAVALRIWRDGKAAYVAVPMDDDHQG